METGSLAEWVEGIAETVALIVALFLPIITERNKARRIKNKLQRIGLRLAKKALEQKMAQNEVEMIRLNEYKAFKRYIGIVFTFNDSQDLFTTLWEIDSDLKQISAEKSEQINELEKINKLLQV